jgi:hypothetical protein
MTATTAKFNYVASLYERCVDASMDVHAIRLFLAEHGIRRSPAQVVYDLTYVYEFASYADSHPAPPPHNLTAIDAAVEAMSWKEVRLFNEAWDNGIRTAYR